MKNAKLLAVFLTLCLTITLFTACDFTKPAESTEPAETECNHQFNQGYCIHCNELDPNCIELTPENYADYLSIQYRIANVDGSNGPYGFVPFPYLFLTASAKSSRITFYNVSIEMNITVQQALYDSGGKYEECTINVVIPVSLLGEGKKDVGLDRESSDPVYLKNTYISDFEIVSITGCISLD